MLALVTALAAAGLDPDLAPLLRALDDDGVAAEIVSWDDPSIDWSRFDAALLRSTWDYADRIDEFSVWLDAVVASTRLVNPIAAVRWSLDKHYLDDLAAAGVAVAPTTFVEVGDDPLGALDTFADAEVFVVKPAIGAGSNGARRCRRDEVGDHVATLHAGGFSAMVQPYLDMIDEHAETALVHLGDGGPLWFDHAFSKQAILTSTDVEQDGDLFAKEEIGAVEASDEQRALAAAVLSAPVVADLGPLAYARVDAVPTPNGPVLLELELVEPSLYFHSSDGSEVRAARAWVNYLAAST